MWLDLPPIVSRVPDHERFKLRLRPVSDGLGLPRELILLSHAELFICDELLIVLALSDVGLLSLAELDSLFLLKLALC